MRLVGDPLEVVTTRRARQPGLAVNREVLAELVLGKPTGSLALAIESLRQHFVQRRQHSLAFVGLERLQRRVGREFGAMQDVVGIAASDAGDRSLVAQDRVDASSIVGGTEPLRELVARRFRAELRERAVVAEREHPPTRLALRTELAEQHRAMTRKPEPDDGTLRWGALRWLFEIEPAGLREMEHGPQGVVEVQRHVFR